MYYWKQQKYQGRLHITNMVILSNYELIENPEKGVFCKEQGADSVPML